jgi:methylated-DNA-[protein]-cysteine S-methyltransferase
MSWSVYESPVGPLTVVARGERLQSLFFPGAAATPRPEESRRPEALAGAHVQLEEYFAGERREFDLPLEPVGPPSLRRIWRQLLEIPYGETISYKELAEQVGRPGEFREIGAAVGRTPLPILIPCHRVVAANGDLTGYGGGLQRKRALLDLEAGIVAMV